MKISIYEIKITFCVRNHNSFISYCDMYLLRVWNGIYFKIFFRSNFSESLQLNGSNVCECWIKRNGMTRKFTQRNNAKGISLSQLENPCLVYTACVVYLYSDSERCTSGTIYAVSCWEHRSHAEEGRICEKYTVYPQQRIVRNITADSNVLHAVEREDIWIFLFFENWRHIHTNTAKTAARSRAIEVIQLNGVSL